MEAILNELVLAQSGRADPATVARVGFVTRAGRTVQGTVTLDVGGSDAVVEATVASEQDPAGDVVSTFGRLPAILELEKELVLEVSAALGYEPTLAERTRVLENGTQNLAAFLAFSSGLEAQAQNDFELSASYFQAALAEDPDFEQARTELAGTRSLGLMAGAAAATLPMVGRESDAMTIAAMEAAGSMSGSMIRESIRGSVLDVAGLDGERTTLAAGEPDAVQETGALTGGSGSDAAPGGTPTEPGTIRVRFEIP